MLIPRGTAILSECGLYRPWLERDLGGQVPLVSIGANPSTADAIEDDRTIEREQDYALRWGCSLLVKVNMYAYRTKSPAVMWAAQAQGIDIVGADIKGLHNDEYILRALRLVRERGGIVLCTWGKIAKRDRVAEVLAKIFEQVPDVSLNCIGTNGDGSPWHPLYRRKDLEPVYWDPGSWRHAA